MKSLSVACVWTNWIGLKYWQLLVKPSTAAVVKNKSWKKGGFEGKIVGGNNETTSLARKNLNPTRRHICIFSLQPPHCKQQLNDAVEKRQSKVQHQKKRQQGTLSKSKDVCLRWLCWQHITWLYWALEGKILTEQCVAKVGGVPALNTRKY